MVSSDRLDPKPVSFSSLLSSPDERFLSLFTASRSCSNQQQSNMSKLPTASGSKSGAVSRLAQPGSMSKRPREGSADLETGLDNKKAKVVEETEKSNLAKSKSKSMMNVGASTTRGRVTVTRPGTGSSTTRGNTSTRGGLGARQGTTVGRRETTTALNDRTNRAGISREKTTLEKKPNGGAAPSKSGGGAAPAGKRPAWDLKGRLEDMERMLGTTTRRVEDLETEKEDLQTDVEVKKEVVVQSSEEIKALRTKIENSEGELETLRKLLLEKEDNFNKETLRLRRELEEEQFAKSSLERRLKGLEDELASKQTEVGGLRNSVAELSSSRAGVEASLAGTKVELESARVQVRQLQEESREKSSRIEAAERGKEECQEKMRWEETERRRLHNLIQELKGNIRVFCRVRPLLGEEKVVAGGDMIKHVNIEGEKNMELIKTVDDAANESIAGGLNKNMKYDFEFDRVFGPQSSQADVFAELSQLVQSALDGYNVCVFAYGQTGSGKTFTMEGGHSVEEEEQAGMIPRTIRQIFEVTERLKEKCWQYKLQASFLEIYNEEIRDLLAVEQNLKYDIKMTDSKGSDLHVTNLRIEEVTNEGQIASLLRRARKVRAQAKTLCNERSSRSHSVFTLRLEGKNSATTETCLGTLNLVDLAGSERIKESGNDSGVRLSEAQAINKSLSNLGNVIMALAQKSSHVPYRNSKLTHLLQGSLGGNSKTLMFVNVSPKEECFSETLNSLRFATKVNQCNIGTAQKKSK